VIAVGGGGGLLGAAAVSRLRSRFGDGTALLLSLAVGQTAMLLIPAAAQFTGLAVLAALVLHQLFGDSSFVAFDVLSGSLRQRSLRVEDLGKAQGGFEALEASALTIGTILAGVCGDAFGPTTALWLGVLGGLLSPLPLVGRRAALSGATR
jgi:predicted MFS family arabinose efflux permease